MDVDEPMPALRERPAGGPTVEDLTFDDSLDDMQRIARYTSSAIALQRLVHVKMIAESCHRAGFSRTCEVVLPLLPALVSDEEFMLRQHLAEQLQGLAEMVVHQGGEQGYSVLLHAIIPAIARLVADPQAEVRISAGEALVAVASWVRKEDLGARILTIVLQLAHDDEQEELRMTAAVLLNELAGTLGAELCVQFVAPEVICLAEDPVFKVRKAAALNLDAIARTLGPVTAAKRILPTFLALAHDDIWGVRKACAEALVSLSKCLEPSVRTAELTPLFERFAIDPSKWVRNAAFTHLGPFLATISGPKITPALLAHYTRMAVPDAASGAGSSDGGGGASAGNGGDLAMYCAFSFPAVAFTLGRARWGELRAAFAALARDEQPRVRKPLAFALGELSRIVGQDAAEADLLPVFELFSKDVREVRSGVLKCMGAFLSALAPPVREACLPLLTDTLTSTAPLAWRDRHLLASQLPALAVAFSPAATFSVIAPWALVLLSDPVACVREEAARGFGPLVARLSSAADGSLAGLMVARLTDLAESRCYRERTLYVRLCSHLLGFATFPPPPPSSAAATPRDAQATPRAAAPPAPAAAAAAVAGLSDPASSSLGTASPANAADAGAPGTGVSGRPLPPAAATAAAPGSAATARLSSFPDEMPLVARTFRSAFLPHLLQLADDPVRNVRVAVSRLLGPLSDKAAELALREVPPNPPTGAAASFLALATGIVAAAAVPAAAAPLVSAAAAAPPSDPDHVFGLPQPAPGNPAPAGASSGLLFDTDPSSLLLPVGAAASVASPSESVAPALAPPATAGLDGVVAAMQHGAEAAIEETFPLGAARAPAAELPLPPPSHEGSDAPAEAAAAPAVRPATADSISSPAAAGTDAATPRGTPPSAVPVGSEHHGGLVLETVSMAVFLGEAAGAPVATQPNGQHSPSNRSGKSEDNAGIPLWARADAEPIPALSRSPSRPESPPLPAPVNSDSTPEGELSAEVAPSLAAPGDFPAAAAPGAAAKGPGPLSPALSLLLRSSFDGAVVDALTALALDPDAEVRAPLQPDWVTLVQQAAVAAGGAAARYRIIPRIALGRAPGLPSMRQLGDALDEAAVSAAADAGFDAGHADGPLHASEAAAPLSDAELSLSPPLDSRALGNGSERPFAVGAESFLNDGSSSNSGGGGGDLPMTRPRSRSVGPASLPIPLHRPFLPAVGPAPDLAVPVLRVKGGAHVFPDVDDSLLFEAGASTHWPRDPTSVAPFGSAAVASAPPLSAAAGSLGMAATDFSVSAELLARVASGLRRASAPPLGASPVAPSAAGAGGGGTAEMAGIGRRVVADLASPSIAVDVAAAVAGASAVEDHDADGLHASEMPDDLEVTLLKT